MEVMQATQKKSPLLIWAIVLIFFFLAFAGLSPVRVLIGNSMKPAMGSTSIALANPFHSYDDLHIGDIVLFDNQTGVIIAHRISTVLFEKDGLPVYSVRGDGNETQVETLTKEKYKGKVLAWVTIIP